MTRQESLRLLERMLDLAPHTLTGTERLKDEVPWDSLSSLTFIAEVDKHFRLPLPGNHVVRCKTVEDLIRLVATTPARPAA